MKKYVYPKLFGIDLLFFRYGGNGLANCMLVVAYAIMIAKQNNAEVLRPTWERFSISNYIRGDKDKRHYVGLFKNYLIGNLRKIFVLFKNYPINLLKCEKSLQIVSSFDFRQEPFFLMQSEIDAIRLYFINNVANSIISRVNCIDFQNVIAVHIRMGDYKNMKGLLTPMNWYVDVLQLVNKWINPKKIYVFSDGLDNELKQIFEIDNVQRCFTGSAIGDIIAMSKCRLIIGSSSSFSAWSAFLGQVPIVAEKMHFGRILLDSSREYFFDKRTDSFVTYLKTI